MSKEIRIFKFGGASVKNAEAVKNVAQIIKAHNHKNIVIIISAMGKMTNALEKVVHAFFNDKTQLETLLADIKLFHYEIANELFKNEQHPIFEQLHNEFISLEWELDEEPTYNYAQEYDQIVSKGELLSTLIVAAYLNEQSINTKWLDARDLIKTDNTYREGKINWPLTQQAINNYIDFKNTSCYLTQGFIGSNDENYTVTLGREGSDYTASILSYCLDAVDLTIWKDVPGVLTADPKYYPNATLIKEIHYHDAIELTYYGATVIHPKTIKPLQNKNIPLHVKSFIDWEKTGTSIGNFNYKNIAPSVIFKANQLLISISSRDFSFIVEENLAELYHYFAQHQVKIHLMQNSALNFSVVTDDTENSRGLINYLNKEYKVLYNEHIKLITIRYYTQQVIDEIIGTKKQLLVNKSRTTAQFVVKE